MVSTEHNSSSAVLKLEAWCCTGQKPSIVAITYYNQNIVAPRVSPEHMSRSAASTALEPEGCGCNHLGAMLCSNNIIRYHRRSSKGFAGTQLVFRSFEVRGLVLYRPAAKHCSNNILQREHRSSKGFVGTHVEICCFHIFGA